MTWYEILGVFGSGTSIIGFIITLWYLPTLINLRKSKKIYKNYLNPKLILKKSKFYSDLHAYYHNADLEERKLIRESNERFNFGFHKDILNSIFNMNDNMEAIIENESKKKLSPTVSGGESHQHK